MKLDKTDIAVIVWAVVASLFVSCNPAYASNIPDPKLTPGEVRNVTVQTLCTTSTKLVRNVPKSVSNKVYVSYGMTGNYTGYCNVTGGCELDHDISLSLGGSNGQKNLFPMPYSGACNAHDKDKLEFKLYMLMCKGTITMKQAQKSISGDWRPAYKKYINAKGCN